MSLITLTTDFSTHDWYVGTMKGVIFGIAPRATVVDITHEIPPGDIRAGAFALAASCRYFRKGTIHVAVIDPGVGSQRGAIAVQTANQVFVGPDNGVLSLALAGEKIKSIRKLTNAEFFHRPVSRTFHGRDVFAPVAAHLILGRSLHEFGPAQKNLVQLPLAPPRISGRRIKGEVMYVDQFGNAITNITPQVINAAGVAAVWSKQKRLCPIGGFYQAVPKGRAIGVIGPSGFLEIAVNGGSAARRFRLKPGSKMEVR